VTGGDAAYPRVKALQALAPASIVAHSLSAARSRLAAARRERIERLTENVDIVLPA
jgi:hypothetical protein